MPKSLTIDYGVDEQRRKSVYTKAGKTTTRYYIGDYEEEIDNDGNLRKIHYLSGAVLIQNGGVDSLLYTHTDYQSSLIALSNANGAVVERYAYDPWGNRRKPNNWAQQDNRTSLILNRGYTGHEHLDHFGVINMNGRVYDPMTAQFFSPDPYVQAPGDWLNYNRYGYCLNNPMRYTDPSGEWILEAIMLGAAMNAIAQTGSGNVKSGEDLFGAVGIGGIAGLMGGWAGNLVNGALDIFNWPSYLIKF